MKTAKEILESNINLSREKFGFDESSADSLSEELQLAIVNATDCNIPYAAYYACKYSNYNNEVIAGIIKMVDLSYYPEYWVERMITSISERVRKNINENPNEYIRYLAMYPQDGAEENLDFNVDFVLDSFNKKNLMIELSMNKWDFYYHYKTNGRCYVSDTYSKIAKSDSPYTFLKGLIVTLKDKLVEYESLNRLDKDIVNEKFVGEVITGKAIVSPNVFNWFVGRLEQSSPVYKELLSYMDNASEEPALNIDFEEVI